MLAPAEEGVRRERSAEMELQIGVRGGDVPHIFWSDKRYG